MHRALPLLLSATLLLPLADGCSRKGLVSESIPADRLPVTTRFETESLEPRFVVYGDNRPGWRVLHKFLDRSSWLTWKMALVPFYQIYMLGNGIVGGVNWLRNVPDYGSSGRTQVRRALLAYAEDHSVDFVLNTGDIVTDGRYPRQWRQFIDEGTRSDPFLERLRFVPVAGNHDDTGDSLFAAPNYQAVFAYPRFYTLRFRNAVLVVIDSNVILDQDGYLEDAAQDRLFSEWIAAEPGEPPAWLEQQLAASDRPYRIVAMHHPPISFGKHHRDWYTQRYGTDLLEKRRRLLAVLQRYRVQLLLTGHEHLYEHSVLVFEGPGPGSQELHSVVSGGGGTPLRRETKESTLATFEANFESAGLDVHLVKQVSMYHFCEIAVGDRSLEVKVWEAMAEPEGGRRLVDSFEIAL